MKWSVNNFTKICAESIPFPEPIYEFGSFQVDGQEDRSDLRIYFKGQKYVGADMRPGKGVDVILDLHKIDLPDESVGSVLLLETIEHVEYPRKAIDEIYRILKPNGVMIMSSQMYFPIHDYPYDYWRFTPEAFKSLLKPFRHAVVTAAGEIIFPHTIVGIGFKGPVEDTQLNLLNLKLDTWKKYWTAESRPKGFKRFLKFLNREHDNLTALFSRFKKT